MYVAPSVDPARLSFAKLRSRLLPLLVLAITLITTFIVWDMIDDGFTTEARHHFQDTSEKIVTQLVTQLHKHEEVLKGGAGLFKISDDVTRKQWREYVSVQQFNHILSGILGIGYAVCLTPEEKTPHIHKIRSQGFPEYRITPEGERPVYIPVTYLEPLNASNLLAIGFDMYSESNRLAAMNQAKNSGEASLATGVILLQETETIKPYGLLMYLPVYKQGFPTVTREQRRSAIKGFIYSPIRLKEFVYGTLGKLPTDIAFEIFDGTTTQSEKLRFSSLVHEKTLLPASYRPSLASSRTIELYGRTWTFVFKSLPSFDRAFNKITSYAILITGILISLLLSGIAYMLQTTSVKAQELAQGMTQELRESEEKLRLILHTVGEAIYGIDMAGRCTFANPTCLRLLGYQAEEILGKQMHKLVHHSHADGTPYPGHECLIFNTLITNIGCHVDREVYWRGDGTNFPVEYWSIPQEKDGEVVGAVVTFLDITDRINKEAAQRKQETILIQKEKMASLGQLAAGVAHEINNPMGFVAINLSVMSQYFDRIICYDRTICEQFGALPKATRDSIEASRASLDLNYILTDGVDLLNASRRGVERVKKIVGDLKTFARNKPEDNELTDLNSCMESALTIVYNELKYVATINKKYGSPQKFLCNPDQMSQVFLNLLVNAAHAIVPPGEIVLSSWHDDTYVYAAISDTGTGIPEAIRDRLFEPFFTTKEVGKGTGLGLSVSYEIIKKHNGTIQVDSQIGVGTTFTVILPRTSEATA